MVATAFALGSCSAAAGTGSVGSLEVGLRHEATLAVVDGVSEPFDFHLPPGTEVISVLASTPTGEAFVQLGSLTLDGRSVYEARPGDVELLRSRWQDHEAVTDASGFVQEVHRGRFAFTYPFAPGRDVASGPATIAFLVSGDPSIDVEVLAYGSSARTNLHVVAYSPGERTLSEEARVEVAEIFRPAAISVTWEDRTLPAWAPGQVSDLDAESGTLRLLTDTVATRSTGAVNLVIVDSLPGGISGLSTGIPGPHDGTGAAITVTFRDPAETARLVAHEIGHLLGLRHLEDRSSNGVVVTNPILDTRADAFNLMQFGTNLTDGQAEMLRLSPLLGVPEAGSP